MDESDKKRLWNNTLESIKVAVSGAIFSTWFTQTYLISVEQSGNRYILQIGCASSFVKSTIETRYFGLVQDSLEKILGGVCDIVFVVKQLPSKKSSTSTTPLFEVKNTPENLMSKLKEI